MKEKIPFKPIIISVAALVLLYTLLGFFFVPVGIKKALETAVDNTLEGRISTESVRFNPFTLEGRIHGLGVKTEAGASLLSVDQVYVNISAASLFKLAPVIDALAVDAPKVVLATDKEGRLTIPFKPERADGTGKTDDAEEKGALFGFRLANVAVNQGELTFTDGIRQVTHHVRGFSLTVPLVSTLKEEVDRPVTANAALVLNDAKIGAVAVVHPFGPEIEGKAHVTGEDMALKTFLPYVPLPPALELTSPGVLAWDLDFGIVLPEQGAAPKLSIQGSAGIKDIAADLKEQGPLARISGLRVEIDTPDLMAQGGKLALIRIDRPEVFLERDSAGELTALALLESGKDGGAENEEGNTEEQQASEKAAPPFSLVLDKAEVKDGRVHIKDGVPEGGFETLLSPVSVNVENLSLRGETLGLSAEGKVVTAAGESLTLEASVDKDGEKTRIDGRLVLEDGSPGAYDAYLAPFTKHLLALDKVNASSDFSLEAGKGGLNVNTKAGTLAFSGFRFGLSNGEEANILDLPGASVTGIEADLAGRTLHIGSVEADQGTVAVRIDRKGRINLMQAMAPLTEGKNGEEAAAGKETPKKEDASPWQVSLGDLGVKGWQVSFQDDSRGSDPVKLKLSDIGFIGKGLTTAEKAEPGRIEGGLTFQNSGRFTMAGTLDPAAKKARLGLKLNRIGIHPFEPYFTKYLNIDITEGSLGADTTLSLSFPEGGKPSLSLTGKAGISDLFSKDKLTGNDFFRCKSLFVSGMDIALWPIRADIKDVSLTDFYSRAILSESGQLNLKTILAKEDDGKETPPEPVGTETPAGEIPEINISNITLQGGHINFTDRFTQPNYTANMTQVAGSVTNLSSTSEKPADLVLKGVHGLYSPLDITGKLRPFGQDRMVDMGLSFKNIDLTQFNAYAAKYLGYEIETGKLILTLAYHIRGNQLESSNRIFFDQFNLGRKVESDTATSLPIELAISLLKNSKDQIDLDIPVHGDLDDPDFSFGGVAAEAIKNLIVSVVAAPFKLLGKVFGAFDSGELGYVAFRPGDDTLDEEARTKLDQLAKILSEKTKLKFIILGKYDPDLDARALRILKYHATLMALAGETGEQVLENPEMRLKLAAQLYAVAEFPKPRDEQGREKDISPEEMEKLLLTNTVVTEADLTDLATRRGQLIMDYLAAAGPVDPGRLFLQNPGPAEDEDKAGQDVKTIFQIE